MRLSATLSAEAAALCLVSGAWWARRRRLALSDCSCSGQVTVRLWHRATQQAGDERRRTALRHGSRRGSPRVKGTQVRTISLPFPTSRAASRVVTGLVLRVATPRTIFSTRTHTGNVYACLLGIYCILWLSITLGALLGQSAAAAVRICGEGIADE